MSVDETPRTGFDRRSALKKAAVAGTVAWTAPAILSETAHAVDFVGACTEKCAPNPSISIGGATRLVCNTNGAKWAAIDFTVTGVGCPCQAGGPVASASGTVSPNPADIKSIQYDAQTNTGVVVIGGQGNGALGNGDYTLTLATCVQCNTRSNPPQVIRRVCVTEISFTFQPADGPCSAASNVGAASIVSSGCLEPECAICPTTGP